MTKTVDLKRRGSFQNSFFGLCCHPVDLNRHNLYLMLSSLSLSGQQWWPRGKNYALWGFTRVSAGLKTPPALTSAVFTFVVHFILSHWPSLRVVAIFSIWRLRGDEDKSSLTRVIITLKGWWLWLITCCTVVYPTEPNDKTNVNLLWTVKRKLI